MEMPVITEQIPTPEVVKQWEHLQEVAERLPAFMPGVEIGMLIGSNCLLALEPLEVVPSKGGGPYAMRLHHGWTLTSPLQVKNPLYSANISSHRITVQEVESVKEIASPQAIQMFELDFNDQNISPNECGYSQEDKTFTSRAKERIEYHDGHYVIPLPFTVSDVMMPNKDQAAKRAIWQRKKMLCDENYWNDCCEHCL